MSDRVMGMETEYAFRPIGPSGTYVDDGTVLATLLRMAKERVPYLPDMCSPTGVFIASGRLYIDCGGHPEFATAEANHPTALLRNVLASERLLAELAREMAKEGDFSEVIISRCNVDYSGSTWGCHDNHQHHSFDDEQLRRQMIPFLVSRVALCGAGGFNPKSAGLEFSLSPRVAHLDQVQSSSTTEGRGIYHGSKEEDLGATGYRRLHVISGESLCSHVGIWWKMGATSLVVAVAEAGLRPAEHVQPAHPLDAMRTFASDVTCTETVLSTEGEPLSVRTIQRAYLDTIEKHLHDAFMPPWAEEVCACWHRLLDLLDPDKSGNSAETTLDWAIKLALYRQRLRRGSRIAWDDLVHWNRILARFQGVLREKEYPHGDINVDFILGPESPIREEVDRQEHYVRRHKLDWRDFTTFLVLRSEFRQIDMRFGQLGERGIFNRLDAAGVLTHHVPGLSLDNLSADAVPEFGRARVRAECIRRLSGNLEEAYCNWDSILDTRDRRLLDLTDPFVTEEHWRTLPKDVGEGLSQEGVADPFTRLLHRRAWTDILMRTIRR